VPVTGSQAGRGHGRRWPSVRTAMTWAMSWPSSLLHVAGLRICCQRPLTLRADLGRPGGLAPLRILRDWG